MPLEANDPVKTTGVAENEEDTDPHGTDKVNQPSSEIDDNSKSMTDEGERETP